VNTFKTVTCTAAQCTRLFPPQRQNDYSCWPRGHNCHKVIKNRSNCLTSIDFYLTSFNYVLMTVHTCPCLVITLAFGQPPVNLSLPLSIVTL